ncbi:MAG: coenzyme F420-0:L-glutamate ligase [Chloroflexota bacterium]|nr:coenzyme F420-0:L-glutamate ligase [Chloroflexota bacterium]
MAARAEGRAAELRLIGLEGIPEIEPGDALGVIIAGAIQRSGLRPVPGDVLVVTQKVVSKAEGRIVVLADIEPSGFAHAFAERWGKDPRQIEVVLRESARIVRMDRGIIIAETHHGFICANAGVDASNVAPDTVCLLPVDPDQSAARLRHEIAGFFEIESAAAPGVVISDSFGRPWRAGQVNVAIGVAGLAPVVDYRGQRDGAGYELHVTMLAVADELASAAELLTHKLAARPVVVVRGYEPAVAMAPGTGRDLVLSPERDLFR